MVRLRGKSGLAWLLVAGLCVAPRQLAAQTTAPKGPAPTTTAHQRKPHASHKKAAVQPEVAPTPVIPPTLEQSPPTPPQVSYQNGQLSITALNATLGQVLKAVQAGTGASVELPSSAANERVVTRLGPGRATDVLNALLTGSKFNYIILGVDGNPGAVQKVILTTPKQGANNAQNNPGQGTNQRQEEDSQEEEIQQAIGEEVQPAPPTAPVFRPQPPMGRRMPEGAIQPPTINNPNVNNPDTNPNTGTKTPEQLLQELQQMQQQQQQMQDQLNPANRQPPQ